MRMVSTTNKKRGRTISRVFCAGLFILSATAAAHAAAPPRAKPYKESICNTDPNVFFCEDFEGEDIYNLGNPGGKPTCASRWGNPALYKADGKQPSNFCWGGGGSYQYNTTQVSGFGSQNRVWRVAKSGNGFTDILTGINTGVGSGDIHGYFPANSLGKAHRDWYARLQVWFSQDFRWPDQFDVKLLFHQPAAFVDNPSSVYQMGIFIARAFFCSASYGDVPIMRYGPAYDKFPVGKLDPVQSYAYCPALPVGEPADGKHAVRLARGRWYTIEYHVRLSSKPGVSDGMLEMWLDGNLAYSRVLDTCRNGCPDMGYTFISGYMNRMDRWQGYLEIDNVVMSRSYIGPPGASSAPPTLKVPEAPVNLQVSMQ